MQGHDRLMENRSNHIYVGAVVLVLILLTLGFIVWLADMSDRGGGEYDIYFRQSVDGLAKGSIVTFAGVPAGKVEQIALQPDDPQFVRVRISVDEAVPILKGTTATVASVGFTGVSQVNLDGAMKGAAPITELGPEGIPVIPTRPGALGELLNNAPKLLENLTELANRLNLLLSDKNRSSITGILANVDQLSRSLADRGPEIAATLAESRVAIKQAGDAAEKIGLLADSTNTVMQNDIRPAMTNLNKAVQAADRSLTRLDTVLADVQPGMRTLSTQTIPEANQLISDLAELSRALSSVASRLDHGGAGAVLGGNKLPEYKPRH